MGPIVLKLGGEIATDPPVELLTSIVSLAMQRPIVVVHGGGALLDETLASLGHSIQKIEGLRVTPKDQIGTVAGVLAGTVNAQLVAKLKSAGGTPVGLTLGDGAFGDVARIEPHQVQQLGCVGSPATIRTGDGDLLRTLSGRGWTPVVACIGSHEGELLNVNADDAASAVARSIGAELVVLLTDVPGVIGQDGSVLEELDHLEAERLIDEQIIHGGMTPKVRAASQMCQQCGCPVIIAKAGDLTPILDPEARTGTVFRRRASVTT